VLVLGSELGPEPPDVDVHGPGAAVEVVAPHLAQEGRAGEHAPRVGGEEPEELELLEREVERAAGDRDPEALGVEHEGPQAHRLLPPARSAAEHREPDPDLGLARPREQQFVGDLGPGEPLQVPPLDDRHGGDPGLASPERPEHRVGLPRVLHPVHEDRPRAQREDVLEPLAGEGLGLEVELPGGEGGDDLARAAIGEEDDGRHARRAYQSPRARGTLDLR